MSACVIPRCGRPFPVSSILTATTALWDGLPPVNGLIRSGGPGGAVALLEPDADGAAVPDAAEPPLPVPVPVPVPVCVHPARTDPASSRAATAPAVRGVIWRSPGG